MRHYEGETEPKLMLSIAVASFQFTSCVRSCWYAASRSLHAKNRPRGIAIVPGSDVFTIVKPCKSR